MENTVELCRPQITIEHMCIACWISKATNTCSKYVILIAFPLEQWLRECTSLLHLGTLSVLLCMQVGSKK